jgi:hypothetical protein
MDPFPGFFVGGFNGIAEVRLDRIHSKIQRFLGVGRLKLMNRLLNKSLKAFSANPPDSNRSVPELEEITGPIKVAHGGG